MVEPLEQPPSVRRRRLWSIFRVPRLVRANTEGACFICNVVDGPLRTSHHIVYEDDETIAFLARWPPLWGTTLVCPKTHIEHVVVDQGVDAYLRVQRIVHHVGRAGQATVPCERLYVLSLGSKAGNSHVHWHLAPLPPGVPPLKQQCRSYEELLMGRLDVPDKEYAKLANAIRSSLAGNAPTSA